MGMIQHLSYLWMSGHLIVRPHERYSLSKFRARDLPRGRIEPHLPLLAWAAPSSNSLLPSAFPTRIRHCLATAPAWRPSASIMPPKASSKAKASSNKTSDDFTPEQKALIEEYLADKPDFKQIIAEAQEAQRNGKPQFEQESQDPRFQRREEPWQQAAKENAKKAHEVFVRLHKARRERQQEQEEGA
jgi:hypothetical protein